MSLPVSTLYAATNRSLGLGETLQSDIGKRDNTEVLTKFGHLDEVENARKLEERLDLSYCELSIIPDFHFLVGRHRLRDLVLINLVDLENQNNTKQHVLSTAISASVDDHCQKLTARFRAALRDIRESRLLESIYVGITFFNGN